ncbi:MAG TPA: response regulator [Pirellulales bacterium]|nr:response regulator [Pirellulales bacterium]
MNHMLIVDDSAVDRQLAGGMLEHMGKFHVEYASDGAEALEHLEVRLPLAVVTDLQMPGMDGLELVQRVSRQFPHVPVILMTAHGSEEIALEALIQGAVDYVPKSRLAIDLPPAVQSVLALSDGGSQERLLSCLQFEEFRYVLENDPRLIGDVAAHARATACDIKITDQQNGRRLAKAVGEAIRNAMFHGNLEFGSHGPRLPDVDAAIDRSWQARSEQPPYNERRVHVDAEFSHDAARITIQDDGRGFNYAALPDAKLDPSCLAAGAAHGLVLIRVFMDEVHFNDAGNAITLVKRRSVN